MRSCRVLAILLALAFPTLLWAQPREGTILFKDGFHLTGKIVEKSKFIQDPASGVLFHIPAGVLSMYLDDNARKVFFPPSQLQEVLPVKTGAGNPVKVIRLTRTKPRWAGNAFLPTWEIDKFGAWNTKGERTAVVLTQGGTRRLGIDQRITEFTPQYMRVDALKYEWYQYYLTRELGAETVRSLVYQYYSDKKDLREADKTMNLAHFLHQAGWLPEADKELEKIIENFPEAKASALELRDNLKKQRTQLFAEEIEQAAKIGQHEEAQQRLERFFKNNLEKWVDQTNVLALQDLKSKYEANNEKIKQATLYLKTLVPSLGREGSGGLWVQASGTIVEELNHDTLPRLETFLPYAQQFLREVKENKKPTQSAEEVLALAISGWLKSSAEPDVAGARLLWKTRQAVLEIQKTVPPDARAQLIRSLAQEKDVTCELLAQVIGRLPPPNPFVPEKGKDIAEPITLKNDSAPGGGSYLVQLPPDYHHNRAYPVLILLPGSREKSADLMSRWTDLAAQNGYLLAAPMLSKGGKGGFNATAGEHVPVLDCLRDLRQRFQVDSDRVFLFGWEEGAEMAYDVGLSHPDQFAGVMPMCGAPKAPASRMGTNAQYLPFYVVDGSWNGANPKLHSGLFKDWIRYHYPALYVEYKGRMSEWYEGEVPIMFRWMNHKKRALPANQVGRYNPGGGAGEEFKTNRIFDRTCDNRFYWLSTEAISDRPSPATLQATVVPGNELVIKGGSKVASIWNQINVRTAGTRQLTIWLSPSSIDFAQPVLVRLNGQQAGSKRLISPSVPTLLEDFFQTGDRQRLFFARIDLKY